MIMKYPTIKEKHVDVVSGKNIILEFPLYGQFTARLFGKIVGRKRNRFKQYVFAPTIPFSSFSFAVSDIKTIEPENDTTFVITLKNTDTEPRKRKRRKKEKPLPVVAAETDVVVDLSPQATDAVAS